LIPTVNGQHHFKRKEDIKKSLKVVLTVDRRGFPIMCSGAHFLSNTVDFGVQNENEKIEKLQT